MTLVGPPVADLAAVELDGLFVIFNPSTGRVSSLNATASQIWRLATGDLTEDAVIDELATRYDVAAGDIRGDVMAALDNLRTEGLLSPGVAE
jgi:hypothetical protein